jgi:hypothetical protein
VFLCSGEPKVFIQDGVFCCEADVFSEGTYFVVVRLMFLVGGVFDCCEADVYSARAYFVGVKPLF